MRYFRGTGYFDPDKCPGDCEKLDGLTYPVCSSGFVADGTHCESTIITPGATTSMSIWSFVVIAIIAGVLLYYLSSGIDVEGKLGVPGESDLVAKIAGVGPKYYV